MSNTIILGAGVTGLCAGQGRRRPVYEGLESPGGLCASYYERSYRFEKGGGHWIFGNDEDSLKVVNDLSVIKRYTRKASVYFPGSGTYVPYPFQNHLYLFPKAVRKKVEEEMRRPLDARAVTLHEWLGDNFGSTLCRLFFWPFHDLYTAGLSEKITPEDLFKNPCNRADILRGLTKPTSPVGYNVTFAYPRQGLDHLMRQIEHYCDVRYHKRAVKIDMRGKKVFFEDGSEAVYKKLISTIPLSETVKLCGLDGIEADPYTSVLVFNIGARKGARCPEDHWVYVPSSQSGFHRVGFYSNVDASFLPPAGCTKELVSMYVEKAFLPGQKPD
ncbi:MAG: FAD-dependent oxidoreductase, partial [Candidatus Omnitrophica bacterium]|nr:FAD-dependent oxidoreductase [Candidatus Omnitrophota bacterium]